MTNHWIDLKNSDCILIMGSNAAENHPISFKWVTRAIENGATLISVDPRFTKTSAKAHIYAPLRSGTDAAFLGGMINHLLENKLYFEEYVREYTNASYLVNGDFKLPGESEGVFSGLQGTKTQEGIVNGKYDKATWSFQKDDKGNPKQDPTLQDPNCVFQLLKKHFGRYTMDKVVEITGTPKEKLLEVYSAYAQTAKPDKAGTVMYAMGYTQHTVGVQNIRAMSIIQLLLGNMGIAGGGVNALRGESNVQGSTDQGLLFHLLPGYLKSPKASQTSLQAYNDANTPKCSDPMSANWWSNFPKYSTSLLREFYGTAVSLEDAYALLPKGDDGQDYSWLTLFDQMYKGAFKGFFAWGQNPACSGANANKVRQAMAKLDWMVNVNLFDNETGSFWKSPGLDPKKIKTEVFMLPCAASMEKEGSISNSGRWMQWRYKAVNPPGKALADGEIINELFLKVRKLYQDKGGKFPDPIVKMRWNYLAKSVDGKGEVLDVHLVAKEINGYFLEDKEIDGTLYKKGALVPKFPLLQADGTTSCGNWIYCASYTDKGNMAARRGKNDPSGIGLFPEWAWAWPLNRRIIYNRASVDKDGKPWAAQKPVIAWSGTEWKGDVPDGPWPPLAAGATGRYPFIMKSDGHGAIFGPGLADGPFPEHYEPLECPVERNFMSPQFVNPTVKRWEVKGVGTELDVRATCDPRFPIIGTTYRVSEHWQTGVMTRWQPWLVEMEPAMFVEMSKELGELKQIKNGEIVMVKSARGELEAVAIVTDRFKPFQIAGVTVHEVGIPWHYGWVTTAERKYLAGDKKPELFTFGDSANIVTPNIGDPNTMIPESKAFMVDIAKKGVK
jgi:formate dehydrogenase major subunit